MAAPELVAELVERFDRNRSHYRLPAYNETQVRREFIDPFFEALGWDIDNRQGYAEAYKDVIHEDAIRISGKHKAPDYCFRVGGSRKFFVEAKKPSVDLARDPLPAFQVRRYAWSAKLPLSILTDFEELAVYDCRVQPEAGDKAAVARTLLVNYLEYAERWEEIAGIFSREAVLRGSFDQYAESATRKRGTAEVDAVFLKDLQAWRELLAHNIAQRSAGIGVRELNFAVQQILDRIVFLRIAEDRGIEEYGRLRAVVSTKNGYAELRRLFQLAEDRYNSGLFHFKPEKGRTSEVDDVTLGLTIDDKPLRQIIGNLYYPESPFEFSVVSSDILGQVYEQFLGQVIRLTPRGRAEVEDKPEVRKAGGVFYTPTFIVDHIVERTVGKLLEGKTPQQVALLRILDPACGSGTFLIAVFELLLNWHLAYYVADGPEKHARRRLPQLYQSAGGEWRLTADEKKRILLNNIYGVDIDPQAVEVTKLSLLLKVLEGETDATLGAQLTLFQERVLPDLGKNIKCGNSLISPQDFYARHQPNLLGEDELYRINPFDWKTEFPQVFAGDDPGFDAIVGNPPYIRIQTMKEWAPIEVEFYRQRYTSAQKGNYDIYVVFVERGLELLNSNGLLGYILPHKFFNAQYGQGLRRIIADGRYLLEVVHFGDQQVFGQATTYTALLFLSRIGEDQFRYIQVDDLHLWRLSRDAAGVSVPATEVTADTWNFTRNRSAPSLGKIDPTLVKLGEVASIFVGLQTSADRIYVLEGLEASPTGQTTVGLRDLNGEVWEIERMLLRPFLYKHTVSSFEEPLARHWLVFPYRVAGGKATLMPQQAIMSEYPMAWRYLRTHEAALRGRESGKGDHEGWYGYIYRKNLTLFDDPKLIVQVISQTGRYALDLAGLYFTGGGNGPYYGIRWQPAYAHLSLTYLQALLSATILDHWLQNISTPFRGGYWSYSKRYLSELPVRLPATGDGTQERYEEIVALSQQASEFIRRGHGAKTTHEKSLSLRSAGAVAERIDALVAGLYNLNEQDLAQLRSQRLQMTVNEA